MKKIISILAYFSILFGQFSDPAEFKFNIKNTNQGEVVILEVQASIEDEWHIYAIYDVPEGPEPTVINIKSGEIVKTGRIIEPDPIVTYDEGFDNITKYHEGNPLFRVPIVLDKKLSNGTYSFDVTVQYQVCTGNLCYPPNEYSDTVQFVLESGNIREQFTVNNFDFSKDSVFSRLKLDDSDIGGFLLISLIMGFAALLTPCVFPMIPITISFFLKRGEDKKTSPIKDASVYMLGIVMTFTLLGMLLAIFLGASGATQLAANPYVNLFIAFLFIYFAFSLFGFYEIEIPQSLKRFSLERESSEGYAGILFMALTFTLTSFTCTVAFMGTILVAASQGEWFWPIIGMLVFSLAFASPFFFLALFPHYLKKLPQSGGWLNSVKVIMGFLEIAAAFKFISH
ncbi:cytochrome c biogenesis protein CcdA [uncultured Paraglaciecola sp.]|uniref:protein-disulfide reductase DsbD family protein n=1 Tax=uncultured Paraglaciecola sp. TaxID=1765024 RepID=UPI0025EEF08B|nr:cytochrome c biogenesis protein CcdA [uncultured Paraglaciecola sp.]